MAEPVAIEGYNDCPWEVDPACLGDEWDSLPEEVQDRARALATSTLRRLTAYRVGGCPIVVRPCKTGCSGGLLSMYPGYALTGAFTPHVNGSGFWVNSCGCMTDCSCTELCEIVLPGPVGEVYEVKVGGAVVSPANYRVFDNRLVWVGDDECAWPACQDLSKPDTEEGTFSVKYLNSYPVDKTGEYAAGILAMEFARSCAGLDCRLPNNITNISRQGVSYEIVAGSFPDGLTGIREVDAFITIWKPPGTPDRQSTVWSPGQRRPRVQR